MRHKDAKRDACYSSRSCAMQMVPPLNPITKKLLLFYSLREKKRCVAGCQRDEGAGASSTMLEKNLLQLLRR